MDNYNETFTLKQQLQALKRLLKYVFKYKGMVALVLFLVLASTMTELIGPLIIKYIVDNVFLDTGVQFALLYQLIAIYAANEVGTSTFRYFRVYCFNDLGYRLARDLRIEVYAKLQSQGMRYFDQTPVGSIVSRVTNDTEAVQDMMNQVFSVIISSIILMIGILVTMLALNWKLGLICMGFIPVLMFIIYIYQKKSTTYYMVIREKLSQLNTRLAESISGMGIIQVFNQEKRFQSEFNETNTEYYTATMRLTKLNGRLLGSIIHLLTSIALVLVFGYAGVMSMNSYISAGLMVAFLEFVYRFFDPMFQIMDRLQIYQQAIVASYRIFKILDNTEVAPQQNEGANAVIKDAKVEFKNITFSYDGKNNVLNDISFTVNPGETVALVGHTGSGKSSIINVMMRFYEYFEGDVLIDGISIKEYPMEHLRESMGLVLQDPFLYYGSIYDNIRLKNKNISDSEVRDACEFVQADSFIKELSNDYNHKVIERGASFSTGQKQLLAFARTIATQPKILILDEATANIDTETEAMIQEGLDRIRRGRTTIAIAHRLSTIKDANQILVLDKGRIVEAGNHEELIAKKGIYFAMYELQQSEQKFK